MASKKSCLLWGCGVFLALGLVAVIVIGIAMYGMYNQVRSFTSPTSVDIPVYQATDGEVTSVKQKLDNLKEAIESGTETSIAFNTADLNTLIAQNPDFAHLKNRVHFTIDGDQLGADVSVPLDEIPGFSGRYLNGSVNLKASMGSNKILQIYAESISVDGKPLPEEFMAQFRVKNLAEDLYKNPEQAKIIRKFQNIEIKDGKLFIETVGSATGSKGN